MDEKELDIRMERGIAVDDGFKYDIIAEFKKRQRRNNMLLAGEVLAQEQEPAVAPEPSERTSEASSKKVNVVFDALSKSSATNWLLALIAFLLFCILISK